MKIEYPIEWSERDRHERPPKGWLGDVVAETDNGKRHRLFFYDPVRLRQDLEEEIRQGRAAVAEHGLIVVPEVTKENIEKALLRQLPKDTLNRTITSVSFRLSGRGGLPTAHTPR